MAFVRSFDLEKIAKLSAEDTELFAKLKADTYKGEVFPAVRKNELHFYHGGGCLFIFSGRRLKRSNEKKYDKKEYNIGTKDLSKYEKAKKQNENKHASKDGSPKERQLLDGLNKHTFDPNRQAKVVVLDIEVRLNGKVDRGKKCDMVLLNTETNQIMFVEGKVFSDKRMKCGRKKPPEVIEQVNKYTAAIGEQHEKIIEQYSEHIRIINEVFGTEYKQPKDLFGNAKLLVYKTPQDPRENEKRSIKKINEELGANNVMWVKGDYEPTIDEIWDALCK